MNENTEENETKQNFSKKIILIIFLLFMLFLNIADFLNLLKGDIDFIEKLLSWSLFGYIFYQASLTKIFIGTKKKVYDMAYIFAFCLISITKSLIYYSQTIDIDKYFIFKIFLSLIKSLNPSNTITYFSFLGILIIIIISIRLLLKNKIEDKSLIGSINFNEFAKFIKLQYLTLITTAIFFGIIVFNFFMEWFALAIDDFMPVIGLFYYLFKYIRHHTNTQASNYLNDVNNSGQNFFESVIEFFSNKKTFLIGISFLLTLHLLVDSAVYIFPYVTGINNGYYFDSLNTGGREHTTLFNFINDEPSRIGQDFTSDNLLNFSIITIYLMMIITFFSLLFMPFYIYYKNIQKDKININKLFATIFLTGLIFIPIIYYIPNVNTPLNIGLSQNQEVFGVDIYTKQITNTENITSTTSTELLTTIILFLITIMFLIFRYEKYQIFFNKIIYICVILFFLLYISLFYISIVNHELNTLKTDIISINLQNTPMEYNQFYSYYSDKKNFKNNEMILQSNEETIVKIIPFSNVNIYSSKFNTNSSHQDFLLITIETKNFNTNFITFDNLNNIYFSDNNNYNPNNNKISQNKVTLIYNLEEKFTLNNGNINLNLEKEHLENMIIIKHKKISTQILENINKGIQYLRLLFLSIFYIFGGIEFATYFTRKNILETT